MNLFSFLMTLLFGKNFVFYEIRTGIKAAIWVTEAEIELNKGRVLDLQKKIELREADMNDAPQPMAGEIKKEISQLRLELSAAEGDVEGKIAELEKHKRKLKFMRSM